MLYECSRHNVIAAKYFPGTRARSFLGVAGEHGPGQTQIRAEGHLANLIELGLCIPTSNDELPTAIRRSLRTSGCSEDHRENKSHQAQQYSGGAPFGLIVHSFLH